MMLRRKILSSVSTQVIAACAIAPLLGLVGPGLARAADATATATSPAGNGELEEVVVTAQRRAQSLESVPVAVQVVQGDALQATNVTSSEDLGQLLPGLHIVNTGSYSNSLNIRGIGSGSGNPAFDQSVATFEDDVYQGRSRLIQSTYLDLAHIEVLKGPQTTFFGNNAIAGALNIQTEKPSDQMGGYARVLYGSYNTYAAEGAVGGPITDTLDARIAAITNGDTGWIKNVDTGNEAPAERNELARLSFLWKPIEDFDALLKIEGGENKITGATSNTPGQFLNCPPPAPLKVGGINQYCPNALASGGPIGINNNDNSGLAGQFAKLVTNDDELTLNYHRWGLTFTSVTAFQLYSYKAQEDNAGVGGPTVYSTNTTSPENYDQFSEELRVASASDQTIEWSAGAYFQSDRLHGVINGNAAFTTPSLPIYSAIGLFSKATLAQLEAALPIGYDVGYDQREDVESVFAATTWNVTNDLKLNGGVRETGDQKHFTGSIAYGQDTQTYGGFNPYPQSLQNSLGFFLGSPGEFPYSRADHAILGSAGLQYQFADRVMGYFTYSHGFKAGGFNAIAPATVAGLVKPSFGPEYVDSYETGVKSEFFNRHVQINADIFREDYSGLQLNSLVQLPANSTIAVTNAAASISQGAELEAKWLITPELRLSVNAAYLDAYYSNYPAASPSYLEKQLGVKSQDLSGRPLDFSPKWSGSFDVEYDIALPQDYYVTVAVTPTLQSSYFNSNGTDDPNFLIKGNARLDARITLNNPTGRWSFDIIGKNVTNANIPVTYGTNDVRGGKEEPFSIAAQARCKF